MTKKNTIAHLCPEWDYMLIHPTDPEWEVCLCEEPEKTLSFAEVVQGWKQGKSYRRLGWIHPTQGYNTRMTIRYTNGQKHFFCVEDFEANDWIEVR